MLYKVHDLDEKLKIVDRLSIPLFPEIVECFQFQFLVFNF